MIGTAFVLLLAGYQFGGTFIGAVICDTGVVIAADSRTTFLDGNGRAFGYMDGMPKIYVDRGSAIAVAGLTSVEGELFSSFVNRNHDLLARPVNEILFGFLVWMPFANSNGVLMISAGFQDGKPTICAKAPILPQTCSNASFISNKNSSVLRDALTKLGRLPTTAEASTALKSAIEESARADPTVGGPVSILTLSPSAPPQWSGVPPTDGGLTQICDLAREHRAGRRRIVPVGTPQELEQHLDAACPRK
jgi:hypothetical protein